MFINFDLQSLSNDALMEKIAQTNKCLGMVAMGNQMSYDSLMALHAALQAEVQFRYEKRMAESVVNAHREIDTTKPSFIAKKQPAKTKAKSPLAGTPSTRPTFVRTKNPGSDNV